MSFKSGNFNILVDDFLEDDFLFSCLLEKILITRSRLTPASAARVQSPLKSFSLF